MYSLTSVHYVDLHITDLLLVYSTYPNVSLFITNIITLQYCVSTSKLHLFYGYSFYYNFTFGWCDLWILIKIIIVINIVFVIVSWSPQTYLIILFVTFEQYLTHLLQMLFLLSFLTLYRCLSWIELWKEQHLKMANENLSKCREVNNHRYEEEFENGKICGNNVIYKSIKTKIFLNINVITTVGQLS